MRRLNATIAGIIDKQTVKASQLIIWCGILCLLFHGRLGLKVLAAETTVAALSQSDSIANYNKLFINFEAAEFAQVVQSVEEMSIAQPPSTIDLQSIYLAAESLYQLGKFERASQFCAFWLANQASKNSDANIIDRLAPYAEFRLASSQIKIGQHERAIPALQRIASSEVDPELAASCLLQLATLQLDAAASPQDIAEVRTLCEQVFDLVPATTPAHRSAVFISANADVSSDEYDAALEKLTQLQKQLYETQTETELQFNVTLLQLQLANKIDDRQVMLAAIEALSNSIESARIDAASRQIAQLQLGLAHTKLNDFESAKSNLVAAAALADKSLGDSPAAAEALMALLRMPSEKINASERLTWYDAIKNLSAVDAITKFEFSLRHARTLVSVGEFKAATDLLNSIVAGSNVDRRWSFAANVLLAETLYRAERFEDAGLIFEKLAADEDIASNVQTRELVTLRLGEIAALKNQWLEAQRSLDMLKILPHSMCVQQTATAYLAGRVAVSQGQFDTARDFLTSAIQAATPNEQEIAARSQWLIGETYFLQRDYQTAIINYERVEQFDRNLQWCSIAKLQAGKCYEMINNPDQAIECFQALIDQSPKSIYVEQAQQRLADLNSQRPSKVNR